MQNWKTTRYIKGIKITEEDYLWIQENKKKKSAAGFLEQIIALIKNSKQFRKMK
jgi:hypothetical protein